MRRSRIPVLLCLASTAARAEDTPVVVSEQGVQPIEHATFEQLVKAGNDDIEVRQLDWYPAQ